MLVIKYIQVRYTWFLTHWTQFCLQEELYAALDTMHGVVRAHALIVLPSPYTLFDAVEPSLSLRLTFVVSILSPWRWNNIKWNNGRIWSDKGVGHST